MLIYFYSHCNLFSIALERVYVIVDPLKGHSLIQKSVVAGRMVITRGQETQCTQAVIDGDYDHLTPSSQLLARELVAGAVHELAVVDVEHDGEELGLSTFNLEK